MKPLKILLNLEARFHKIAQKHDIIAKISLPVGVLILMSEIIWLAGPYLTINGYTPLYTYEKRWYAICACFLAWLLKFLLIDLATPAALQFKDTKTRRKILALEKRFKGAMDFLKRTSLPRQGISLQQTPWIFLLGPQNAGKTTLLANSGIPFILQKQFTNQEIHSIPASENCDWWVTKDASIIDIPSSYLSAPNKNVEAVFHSLWQSFLKLVKKYRGKSGIHGVIIALPIMDMLKNQSKEQYHQMLKDIFQRLLSLQQIQSTPLSCQIVFTKCDLIPGFKEFFSEASQEETEQAWGIHLKPVKLNEKLVDQIHFRFNALIKKINQQLLWRLHQERNPMARPYIKDFPLQLERIKIFLIDFAKQYTSAKLNAHINSIHLTSAIQPKKVESSNILEEAVEQTTTIQLFNHQLELSRPFFINQLLQQGLTYKEPEALSHQKTISWQTRVIYAASISLIMISGFLFGKDFQSGLQHTYVMQKNISDFQLRIAKISNPDDHLIEVVRLLNSLKPEPTHTTLPLSLKSLTSFYTLKSKQKDNEIYLASLHGILLPQIKYLFENYLNTSINKNSDDTYAALKAYLMLGDSTYLNVNYIKLITAKLAKTLKAEDYHDLMTHLHLALNTPWQSLSLNKKTIIDARQHLSKLPKLKMSYVILTNMDNNNSLNELPIQIPYMYTTKAFTTIINQEAILSAQQAISGNWILGHEQGFNHEPNLARGLTDQLRDTYIDQYVSVWESYLSALALTKLNSLSEVDNTLVSFITQTSPLLGLLEFIQGNTNFEPITSLSARLKSLSSLNTAQSQSQVSNFIESTRTLHFYIQPTINANNPGRVAYDLLLKREIPLSTPDAIKQARLVASKASEPFKTWLTNLADATEITLLTEAKQYLNTSWQTEVIHFYQLEIANRYPFASTNHPDVAIDKFKQFFGSPGILINYFNQYLKPLIDTSSAEWHWKSINDKPILFSEDTLRQIQLAMRIHKSFFPNNDDQLHVQFTLQPYELDKLIKTVTLKINDKQFIDDQDSKNNPHTFTWPGNNLSNETSIKLTLDDDQYFNQRYTGNWGWFKLINQSFESIISKKQVLLNLSQNEHPAKYLLFLDGKNNPFSSLDLKHFHLPSQLLEENI